MTGGVVLEEPAPDALPWASADALLALLKGDEGGRTFLGRVVATVCFFLPFTIALVHALGGGGSGGLVARTGLQR